MRQLAIRGTYRRRRTKAACPINVALPAVSKAGATDPHAIQAPRGVSQVRAS